LECVESNDNKITEGDCGKVNDPREDLFSMTKNGKEKGARAMKRYISGSRWPQIESANERQSSLFRGSPAVSYEDGE
jgi:hypothetical protein